MRSVRFIAAQHSGRRVTTPIIVTHGIAARVAATVPSTAARPSAMATTRLRRSDRTDHMVSPGPRPRNSRAEWGPVEGVNSHSRARQRAPLSW